MGFDDIDLTMDRIVIECYPSLKTKVKLRCIEQGFKTIREYITHLILNDLK